MPAGDEGVSAGGTVERAFELARDGRCRTLEEIRRTLAREQFGNVDAHLAGFGIRTQLKALMHMSTAGRRNQPARAQLMPQGELP